MNHQYPHGKERPRAKMALTAIMVFHAHQIVRVNLISLSKDKSKGAVSVVLKEAPWGCPSDQKTVRRAVALEGDGQYHYRCLGIHEVYNLKGPSPVRIEKEPEPAAVATVNEE